jgi:aspartyl-tRNA(Asn)/glutamyl-tRNA(Gln) amidotransferase subunit B
VDANISIHKEGEPYGVRTEVKNIGSIRGVASAITYEIQRQIAIREKGGRIVNETRSYDAMTKTTVAMRDKEVVQDYRFMPEPNLLPLHLNLTDKHSDVFINVLDLKQQIPELPADTRKRLIDEHKISQDIAIILVNEEVLLDFFEQITQDNPKRSPKLVANLLINEYLKICNKNKIHPAEW